MNIIQVDLADPRQVKAFLNLPFRVYRDITEWVPPLTMDMARMLDRRRHPFYRHSEAVFFLAEGDGQAIGRIAALDNRNYNEFNHEKSAFFYLFECLDDKEAAGGLFDSAIGWARARGLNQISGPKGFTALDGMGLLVRGFEHRPALGIPYNPPYYPVLIEAAGFKPVNEIISGYLRGTATFPEKIHRASELIQKRRGLRVERYRTRKDLRRLIPRLKELYNGVLQGTQGNTPLTDDEVQTMADQILWFADPRLIKVIWKEEDPVGFLFAYPDISSALQRTKGRLFPLGWLDILLEMRRSKWVNINGAGIIEEYRGLGGTAILFSEMAKSIAERGFEHADLVQIGVENDKMQRELRELGIDFYKAHRMYQRWL